MIKIINEIHVVIACSSCGSGSSVATVALKQARELAKHFEKVTLVSESFPKDLSDKVKRGKVTPRKFNFLRRFCHVPNEYAYVYAVRKYLENMHGRQKINMIICHGHALATLAAKPLKEKYGITFALVTHGDIFDRPKGTYDSRLTAFYKAVTPSAYRSADLIIALSPYMAECAIRGGAKPKVVEVIPNGIDPEDIGLNIKETPISSTNNILNKCLRLLYVGGLSVPKGLDILISACRILKGRGVTFSLKLIGSGPLETQLKGTVPRMDLSQEIIFLGKIDRNSLGAYYRDADLLIVPSLSDPLPTVVLEALISGTPVIGSDIGGIPFMIENGHNGILMPPKNSTALADAIEGLYKEPERLAKLKKNALPSVFPRFSWESVGKKLYVLIKERINISSYSSC